MRWAGYVVCMGEMRNTYKILVRELEGKRALRRPRCKWEDNIRMVGMRVENTEWMHLA
jgi:hypothetical protein